MLLNTDLATVPAGVWVLLAVIVLGEIALDVVALVDLYRRPPPQVAGGNKWIWVVVIVLVNLLGAIVYLAAGRKPAPAVDSTAPEQRPAGQIADVVDTLYGPREDAGPS